jgi:hypothetical protein
LLIENLEIEKIKTNFIIISFKSCIRMLSFFKFQNFY